MQQVLSSKELYTYLNDFRTSLRGFDYSNLGNIRFFNLESVYMYMENVKNNPFQRQYNELQGILDTLQPYLPFLSSQRAKDFLIEISKVTDDDEIEDLKREYTQKLRMDFIQVIGKIKCEGDWKLILNTCEQIRIQKEEVISKTHLH